MNPLVWSILISSIATSTIITMTSNHWLLAWLGLELNTISILPIMMKSSHPRATEATMKYFMVQATAAACILFASTINAWQTGQWSIIHTNSKMSITLITIALVLKLGLAPVHTWYPEVLQGSSMYTALLISTWQKFAPLSLLYMLQSTMPPALILTIGLLSSITGGFAGLNQTQTRKIMALSSVAHMGWLLVALNMSPSLATLTMLIYLSTTTTMFIMLALTTTNTITDTATTWPTSPVLMTTTMMTLLSLGGLPPLAGFLPKWLILKELSHTSLTAIGTTMLLTSLPSLFFYTRLAYLTMLTNPPTTTATKFKWRFQTPPSQMLTPLAIFTCLALPLAPTLYNTT
uniref:NADH-ubiquinone oxidoreductase chain 2 n=1 Tax=Hemidactylus bowringii TaxID=146913 RepID=A0A0A7E794_9SAUR|nr:NADH dehydrogenase subunit 2 [Hemidactylus bowringii]AIY61199.1 NADH dehydrogenase subunit 2 [Hemidactylus bowringii]